MIKKKGVLSLIIAAIMAISLPVSAMAATTKITSVSLKIASSIEAGDSSSDVEVTTSNSRYSVDKIQITNKPSDEWSNGAKPKIKVTLKAGSKYNFPTSLSKSDISLSGSDGTVSSVSRDSSSKLTVSITLEQINDKSSDYDLDISGLDWDESEGVAYWDDGEDAKKYEVRLYRNDSSVTSALSTSKTSYNFSSYITKSGKYTFKVRGIYNSSNKGSWEESDIWELTSTEAAEISKSSSTNSNSNSSSSSSTSSGLGGPGVNISISGTWLQDHLGWWYRNADNGYTINNWQYINDKWYFFDAVGYMKTGWINWSSRWYYCDESGAMLVSTTTVDGYYVGNDGAWIQ